MVGQLHSMLPDWFLCTGRVNVMGHFVHRQGFLCADRVNVVGQLHSKLPDRFLCTGKVNVMGQLHIMLPD